MGPLGRHIVPHRPRTRSSPWSRRCDTPLPSLTVTLAIWHPATVLTAVSAMRKQDSVVGIRGVEVLGDERESRRQTRRRCGLQPSIVSHPPEHQRQHGARPLSPPAAAAPARGWPAHRPVALLPRQSRARRPNSASRASSSRSRWSNACSRASAVISRRSPATSRSSARSSRRSPTKSRFSAAHWRSTSGDCAVIRSLLSSPEPRSTLCPNLGPAPWRGPRPYHSCRP